MQIMMSNYKNMKIYENYNNNDLNCKFLHFIDVNFVKNFLSIT